MIDQCCARTRPWGSEGTRQQRRGGFGEGRRRRLRDWEGRSHSWPNGDDEEGRLGAEEIDLAAQSGSGKRGHFSQDSTRIISVDVLYDDGHGLSSNFIPQSVRPGM